jgi:hypothetical protein
MLLWSLAASTWRLRKLYTGLWALMHGRQRYARQPDQRFHHCKIFVLEKRVRGWDLVRTAYQHCNNPSQVIFACNIYHGCHCSGNTGISFRANIKEELTSVFCQSWMAGINQVLTCLSVANLDNIHLVYCFLHTSNDTQGEKLFTNVLPHVSCLVHEQYLQPPAVVGSDTCRLPGFCQGVLIHVPFP